MKSFRIALSVVLILLSTAALSQSDAQKSSDQAKPPDNNPLSTFNKLVYAQLKSILLRSAEKMPAENYSFKPTDSVRSFGQIIGHVADAQYMFCSATLGENNPTPKIEETKTSKTDLIAALKDSFAYCDKAYDGMTDVSAMQLIKLFGGDRPRVSALMVNNMHNYEHYGNLVTYMRLKSIVPPTSEQKPPQPVKPTK